MVVQARLCRLRLRAIADEDRTLAFGGTDRERLCSPVGFADTCRRLEVNERPFQAIVGAPLSVLWVPLLALRRRNDHLRHFGRRGGILPGDQHAVGDGIGREVWTLAVDPAARLQHVLD